MNTATDAVKKTKNNEEDSKNITWAKVIQRKEKSKKKYYAGQGEPPISLDNTPVYENLNKAKYKKQEKLQSKRNNTSEEVQKHPDCFSISALVREVSGGFNTQSNDVIEKRYGKNRQESFNNSFDTDTATSSSEPTGSYKTALDTSQELSNFTNKKSESKSSSNQNFKTFKRNALMTCILRNEEDATIEDAMGDRPQEDMRNDRLGIFFQNKEDPDVYEHGLTRLKNDKEWRSQPLQRKGVEVHITPRNYYFNVDDEEDFKFEL